MLALASLTALSSLCLLFGEWWPWTGVAGGLQKPLSSFPGTAGPFWTAGGPLMIALLLTGLLVLLGRPRLARGVLAALILATLLTPAAATVLGLNRPALWSLAGLLLFVALSLTAPIRHRRRVIAAGTITH